MINESIINQLRKEQGEGPYVIPVEMREEYARSYDQAMEDLREGRFVTLDEFEGKYISPEEKAEVAAKVKRALIDWGELEPE